MLALAISLAGAASWGVSDFLGGQQTRRLPVLGVLAVSQPAGLVLVALLIALTGADPICPGGLEAGGVVCGAAARTASSHPNSSPAAMVVTCGIGGPENGRIRADSTSGGGAGQRIRPTDSAQRLSRVVLQLGRLKD